MVKLRQPISAALTTTISIPSITVTSTSSISTYTITGSIYTIVITIQVIFSEPSGDCTSFQWETTTIISKTSNGDIVFNSGTPCVKNGFKCPGQDAYIKSSTSDVYTIPSLLDLVGKYNTFDTINKKMYRLKFYKKHKFIWLKIYPKK